MMSVFCPNWIFQIDGRPDLQGGSILPALPPRNSPQLNGGCDPESTAK
jgi:hypothetical protein